MADDRCAKCGEELKPGALTCWACGTLTAAGRRAKGLPEDEEEMWRRSVQAAKARQTQTPVVDPDEALRRVVAESGTEEQLQRVTRPTMAHDDHHTDYARPRASTRTLTMIGNLLAVLFALTGLIIVAHAVLTESGAAAAVQSLIGLLSCGTAATAVYFLFRYLADLTTIAADAADNARRAVLLLREQASQASASAPVARDKD